MKVLKILLITVLVFVILTVVGLTLSYFSIRASTGIDLIKIIRELNALSQPVDESEICPNVFSDDDMIDVKDTINQSVSDFITYSEENGYNINLDNLPTEMKSIIRLTDKQVGALANEFMTQDSENISVDSMTDLQLKQIDFEISDEGYTVLNTVLFLDLTEEVENLPDEFPNYLLKGFIPKTLYISSTVIVRPTSEAFGYSVEHHSLTLNGLSPTETEELFTTLSIIGVDGTAEEFNELTGQSVMDALVGSEEVKGFAYSLKSIGATGFEFVNENGVDYFIVKR